MMVKEVHAEGYTVSKLADRERERGREREREREREQTECSLQRNQS